MKDLDTLIIGAGPAGILAGIWYKRNLPNKRFIILDRGQIAETLTRVPDIKWHSQMSDLMLPSILNSCLDEHARPLTSELVRYYKEIAAEHQLPVREFAEVTKLSKRGENFHAEVTCHNDSTIETMSARTVINCTGVLERPAPADFTGLEFVNRSFSTESKDMDILVTGSGASAIDLVTTLLPRNRITWVQRSSSNLASRVPAQILKELSRVIEEHEKNLRVIKNASITEVSPDLWVSLTSGESLGPFSCVYALIGYESAKQKLLVRGDLSSDGSTLSHASPRTSQVGMYAFGSITQKRKPSGRLEGASVRRHILDQVDNLGNHIVEHRISQIFEGTPPLKRHFIPRPGLTGMVSRRISRLEVVANIFQLIDKKLWFLGRKS